MDNVGFEIRDRDRDDDDIDILMNMINNHIHYYKTLHKWKINIDREIAHHLMKR